MEQLATGVETSLPRATPEAAGIASRAISDFLRDIETRKLELHSFMLLKQGAIVAEGWWGPYKSDYPHQLFSLSKSFTSTAVGIAAAEGLLSLDDKIVDWFADDVPEEVSPNLAAMKVRHLLMMGTGHTEDTSPHLWSREDGNWPKAFLSLPVEHPPGTHFVYNNGATYMLSALLRKATGVPLLDYLKERLFLPLGIPEASWETCPKGIAFGGWGLNLRTEDIAKFGQLYLQKGKWDGKQLLPEGWTEEASAKQIANGDDPKNDWNQGYGYQFWRCRHGAYRGDGAFGQFCIVLPEQEAVIAITSGTNDMQGVMNAAWEHLLPAMEAAALPADDQAHAALQKQLADLRIDPPQILTRSSLEGTIGGIDYMLEANQINIKSINVAFAEEEATFTLTSPRGSESVRLGRGVWLQSLARLTSASPDAPAQRIEGSLTWQDEATLEITLRPVETPVAFTLKCRPDGEDLLLDFKQSVSFGGPPNETMRARRVEASV